MSGLYVYIDDCVKPQPLKIWHLSCYVFPLTQTLSGNILHLRFGKQKLSPLWPFPLFFCTSKPSLSAFVCQTVALKSHKCQGVHLSPINEGRLVERLKGILQYEMLMSLIMAESQETLPVSVMLMRIIMSIWVYFFGVKYNVLYYM